ncbi:MAG: hypothetical protein D3X82_15555 [Candidatus Leucobacter sulfamidivorax]|nr:hypothetical protein [Candidatus Leucobacter sulfamidivorax]
MPLSSEYTIHRDDASDPPARSADNPVGGWYGRRKGFRGRFAMYLPSLLEALGLVELEHHARNNRIRPASR